MRIFIGGAHNGKRDYVRKIVAQQDIQWFEGGLPAHLHNVDATQPVVIAGIDEWLAATKLSEEEAIAQVMEVVASHPNVIFILTDVGRGIVPIDAKQRQLRDTCGRLYQRLIAQADEVTRIWYGLTQNLKKRGEVL